MNFRYSSSLGRTNQTNILCEYSLPKKRRKKRKKRQKRTSDILLEEKKEIKGKKGKNELQISSLHNSANPDTKQTYLAMHASINFQKKEKQKEKNELQISHKKQKKNKMRIKPMPY